MKETTWKKRYNELAPRVAFAERQADKFEKLAEEAEDTKNTYRSMFESIDTLDKNTKVLKSILKILKGRPVLRHLLNDESTIFEYLNSISEELEEWKWD